METGTLLPHMRPRYNYSSNSRISDPHKACCWNDSDKECGKLPSGEKIPQWETWKAADT